LLSFLAAVAIAVIRRKSLSSGNPFERALKAWSMSCPSETAPPAPAQNVRHARTTLTAAAASTPG
jgi:hypothetical protein